jgi:hypothetical protein
MGPASLAPTLKHASASANPFSSEFSVAVSKLRNGSPAFSNAAALVSYAAFNAAVAHTSVSSLSTPAPLESTDVGVIAGAEL